MPLDNQNDVPLPEAVRRQVARADELAREHGIPGAPELEETPAEDVASTELEPAPQEPSEPAPVPEPTVDWEQRYRTLQGKYDAEMPQLRRDLDGMRILVAQMNAPRSPEPTAEPRQATTTTVVSPEHLAEYGQELIDASRQWARAEIAPELELMRRELNDIRGGQQRVETVTTQQRVEAQLSADPVLAGKWPALNTNPEFIGWLNRSDPFAGRPRMELFHDACARGDGDRVGHFFKSFIAEHTAIQPSSTPQPQTPALSESVAGRPSLEDLAAPGRAAGTGSPHGGAPAEKRIWTHPDIARFYRDRTHGVYAGREAEAFALEQDIFTATREGRIR